jgi:prepilin-type N-terminal cleavage/methylation domain-containing protein
MNFLSVHKPRAAGVQAFTLPEMMVSVLIFSMLILATIGVWLFCLRWDQLVCSKLGASEKSRMSFDILTADIRAAKKWRIGNGSRTTWTELPNQTSLMGNAVQVYADANLTNCFTRYWYDSSASNNWKLNRITCTNGAMSATYQIIAQYLTNVTGNGMKFRAEKYDGTQLEDLQYKYVIATTMEFCQFQYPMTRVGPGYYYNYYAIQFKLASHCPN